MGGPISAPQNHPVDILISRIPRLRDKDSVVYTYKKSLSGFAAYLTEEEAEEMRREPTIISVFPEPVLRLQTTHSWDFLASLVSPSTHVASLQPGSDTIVGVLDSGIWPESQGFDDSRMGPIPTQWKGVCETGVDFNASHCNRKIIGARYYAGFESARDDHGHGTHVASTSVGNPVSSASYYGFASGTARGGFPDSRLAVYRVCDVMGCPGSAVLAAFDDAIADGVDVLSVSLVQDAESASLFAADPIAIGSFHAMNRGIPVICAAGNAGPYPSTVANVAPWIFTVAATTIDRGFATSVVLGNHKTLEGIGGSEFDKMLETSPIYPLVVGGTRECSLRGLEIRGKIVICKPDVTDEGRVEDAIRRAGGVGFVQIGDRLDSFNFSRPIILRTFPRMLISFESGVEILAYINTTRNPPDIAAPGFKVLAAWKDNETNPEIRPPGMPSPRFVMDSGTSMACPHVSGVVAAIKARNPKWTPAAIRSAIMTSALKLDNLNLPITTQAGDVATAYDVGSGELNPYGAINPGLVYDMDLMDYFMFLCFYGYNSSTIRLIEPSLPDQFRCPGNSSLDLISEINYPSIAVGKDVAAGPVQVTRTLSNVDEEVETIYRVSVTAPRGLLVEVEPQRLVFTKARPKMTYRVRFSSNSTIKDAFGAIVWDNGKFKVSCSYVVSA